MKLSKPYLIAYYIAVALFVIVMAASCVGSKYDCAWKVKGFQGYGPAKTGKR